MRFHSLAFVSFSFVAALSVPSLVGDEPKKPTAPAQKPAAVQRSVPAIRAVPAAKAASAPTADDAKKPATKPQTTTPLRIVPRIAPAARPAEEPKPASDNSTHEQLKAVKISGKNGATLQTLTILPDGKVVGLIAPARYAVASPTATTKPVSEVCVLDADGEEVQRWALKFTAQSIATGPDGAIYVAGDGQLAKFDGDGQLLTESELPHIAEILNDKDKLRQQAEEQLKAQVDSIENTYKTFQTQVKALEDKAAAAEKKDGKSNDKDKSATPSKAAKSGDDDEDDDAAGGLNATEKAQLQALKSNLKAYEQIIQTYRKRTVEDVLAQTTSRLRIINGITVTDKEVFVACGELKGYGYAIWRMGRDFSSPKQVLGQIGGCCGQMDIQARGNDLYVAENTKHRVAHYDRDGKLIGAFGQRSRVSEGVVFGGCCNPMNCRVVAGGDVYTAESEGVVKRFTANGEFVELVGTAQLTGGCKNVAVAVSPNGRRVYFCDLPGSRVIVLAQKETKAAAGGEE